MAKVASKVKQLGFEHFKAKAFKFYGRCKQGLLTSLGWSEPWPGGVHAQREGGSERAIKESSDQTVPNVFMHRFMQSCKGVHTHTHMITSRVSGFRRPQQGTAVSPPTREQIKWAKGKVCCTSLHPMSSTDAAHTQGSSKFIKSTQDFGLALRDDYPVVFFLQLCRCVILNAGIRSLHLLTLD